MFTARVLSVKQSYVITLQVTSPYPYVSKGDTCELVLQHPEPPAAVIPPNDDETPWKPPTEDVNGRVEHTTRQEKVDYLANLPLD